MPFLLFFNQTKTRKGDIKAMALNLEYMKCLLKSHHLANFYFYFAIDIVFWDLFLE